jgi:hypothetical protein
VKPTPAKRPFLENEFSECQSGCAEVGCPEAQGRFDREDSTEQRALRVGLPKPAAQSLSEDLPRVSEWVRRSRLPRGSGKIRQGRFDGTTSTQSGFAETGCPEAQ